MTFLARDSKTILLLGCPGLMEALAPQTESGLLLERNPNYSPVPPFSMYRCDLRSLVKVPEFFPMFELAIIDSPWYLDDLLAWMNVALSSLEVGRSVLFVLWPESTRPSARAEHEELVSALSGVGELMQIGKITYETPLFEKISRRAAGLAPFLRSGLLMKFTKSRFGTLRHRVRVGPGIWKRFSLSGAQLAIKVSPAENDVAEILGFEKGPTVLDSTSRRNSALSDINLWTSENVAGKLINPSFAAFGLESKLQSHLELARRLFRETLIGEQDVQALTWQHPE